MGHKIVVGILGLYMCCNCCACQDAEVCCDHVRTTTTAMAQADAHEREVQKMAIATLASMANSLINIGADAYNPQNVGAQVISILSNFVNFVTFALRNPQILDLLENDEFKEALRSVLMEEIIEKKLNAVDNEIL
jgi:polyferredoxin